MKIMNFFGILVTPTASKSINLDLLQRKISTLEIENKSLKLEVAQVVKETDEVEEQERRLMEDITQQLNSTNYQFDGLSKSIFNKTVKIFIQINFQFELQIWNWSDRKKKIDCNMSKLLI